MSTANKKENVLSPVEEKLVKELVTEGREKGFVTIDEINENLGDETPSPEQLEKIFDIFGDFVVAIGRESSGFFGILSLDDRFKKLILLMVDHPINQIAIGVELCLARRFRVKFGFVGFC